MFLYTVLILGCFKVCLGDDMRELFVKRCVNIGDNLSLHLDNLKNRENSSILERYAVRIQYKDYGILAEKVRGRDVLQVNLLQENKEEGLFISFYCLFIIVCIIFCSTAIFFES